VESSDVIHLLSLECEHWLGILLCEAHTPVIVGEGVDKEIRVLSFEGTSISALEEVNLT